MRRLIRSPTLVALFLVLTVLLQNQPVEAIDSGGSRAWVDVEVLYFDGESITARIILRVAGDHVNGSVRVEGEVFVSKDEGKPCFASVCITSSVTVIVGRGVGEVAFSSDTNMTTFQYTDRFVSTYQANTFYGLAFFPWDRHHLTVNIITDFNANIDAHVKRPRLPNANYDGAYNVTRQPAENSGYRYKLGLEIWHPGSFQWSMILWTWVVTLLLLALTLLMIFVQFRPPIRSELTDNNIVTVSCALTFFIPVFELSLQSFKSPLPMVASDVALAFVMILNVSLLFGILLERFVKERCTASTETS